MTSSKKGKLQLKKELLLKNLHELSVAYKQGLMSKEQYIEDRFEMLGGKFEEDVIGEIDKEIKGVDKTLMLAIAAGVLFFAVLIPLVTFDGITTLAFFDDAGTAVLPILENYSQNSTKNLSFITATSLRASGKVYGYGEAWVYLLDGGSRRLVYYADTRGSLGLTGLVVFNSTNSTNNATVINATNTTVNSTNTTNTTINSANATINETNVSVNNTNISINATNTTVNVTNTTNTTVVNSTNSTINTTNSTVAVNETNTTNVTLPSTNTTNETVAQPDVLLDKTRVSVGERVGITVLPESSTYTIYLHAPSESFMLNDLYWIAEEPGLHTVSVLITLHNEVTRISKDFDVLGPEADLTAVFNDSCVETCSLQETNVVLEVVLQGTNLELDNIRYDPVSNATNGSAPPAPEEPVLSTPEVAVNPREQLRHCLQKNPNLRPKVCFSAEELESRFPDKQFTLVNDLGKKMAVFDKDGNVFIKGSLFENSAGSPQDFDIVIRNNDGSAASWIDAFTGDLFLKGSLFELEETLMWENRKDYVVSNDAGMYMGIFDAVTGDLYIRGRLAEGQEI